MLPARAPDLDPQMHRDLNAPDLDDEALACRPDPEREALPVRGPDRDEAVLATVAVSEPTSKRIAASSAANTSQMVRIVRLWRPSRS